MKIRTPRASSLAVRNVMRANKGRDTNPELSMRKALYAAGLRGYRLNWKRAPGKPDIAFVRHRIAIIVHGCFWHGCRRCSKRYPKRNKAYWSWKIRTNRRRDLRNEAALKKLGWAVFTIWEHDIKRGNMRRAVSWAKQRLERANAS